MLLLITILEMFSNILKKIFICLFTAASNCETVAWFHSWMKQLWHSIHTCWMNEFSIFWAFARAYQWCLTCKEKSLRDFPGGGAGEAKTLRSQCKGPGLLPGQGTRSHMPQLRVCMPHLKTLRAPTKDPGCVCVCVCVCESLSHSDTLDPMDYSPVGSSVHGIL